MTSKENQLPSAPSPAGETASEGYCDIHDLPPFLHEKRSTCVGWRLPEPVSPGGATECPNCGAKGDERCHDTEGPPARFVSRHKSRPRLGDSAYLLWEYQGDGLILYWQNPYNNGAKETVAMMMWPTHAPEKTEEIEQLYERMATTFVTAWNGSAPEAAAAGELTLAEAMTLRTKDEAVGCYLMELMKMTRFERVSSQTASAEGDGWIADGVSIIAAERKRQVESEGWTPEHDDTHDGNQIAMAAACYASPVPLRAKTEVPCGCRTAECPHSAFGKQAWIDAWPWESAWDKRHKHDRLHQLAIAGALIAAEIDRLKRLPTPPSVQEEKGTK